jgi:ADP-L-glycero-D-manno-heptose 6-epimerase
MRVVVTGAAGFIGSNLVHALNRRGIDDIVAVDELAEGAKFVNLREAQLADYFDSEELDEAFDRGELGRFDLVFHQGACSDTMQHDGRYMMRTNFRCSKNSLDACFKQGTRLIYASSGAVYGGGAHFAEVPRNERPLNVYGYSKLVFDQVVRRHLPQPAQQVVGLRYFNVYCPREQHKARMASVAFPGRRIRSPVWRVRRLRSRHAPARFRQRGRRRGSQPMVPGSRAL